MTTMNHMRSTRSRLAVPIAIFVGAIITLVVLFVSVNNSDAGETSSIPKTLIGQWHQTGEGFSGMVLDAEVSHGSIQVNMTPRDDRSRIYWLGTFDSDRNTHSSFKTKSLADPDAQNNSILGSLDKTKVFTYKNGVISFKLTILSETVDIHLAKNEQAHTATNPVYTPDVYTPNSGSKIKTSPKVYTPKPAAPKLAAPKAVTPPKISTKK